MTSFLDSLHKSFSNQTTLDLRKERWTFLNRELTVLSSEYQGTELESIEWDKESSKFVLFKFMYSENATKYISILVLYSFNEDFMAFSENPNFKIHIL